MKYRKIASFTFIILGVLFSGIILFANELGLDNNAGWSRTRFAAFFAFTFLTALGSFYWLYQTPIEKRIAQFIVKLENSSHPSHLLQAWRSYSFIIPIMGLVLIIYIWLVSSGTWIHWISPTRYYANLAKGFENGNLFIPGKPDARLSELANPYNPAERAGIDVPIDLSYYNGRYYLYWGPVPSLILLPIQKVFHGRVGDLQLTFAFTCGLFLSLSMTLTTIWRHHFHNLPKWLLGISVLLIGMANPTLFMLNSFKGARIYEAAITGGQFFLASGLALIISLTGKSVSYWKITLVGILWALSIGTRFFLILPVGTIALLLFYIWLSQKENAFKKIVSLSFPLLIGASLLGWYNWARFGSVAESGLYYQFAGHNLQENYHLLIKPIYFLQNVYNYVFQPFGARAEFPYLYAEYGKIKALFSWYTLPKIYSSQQTTGILYSVPFAVFALIPLWFFLTPKNTEVDVLKNPLSRTILILTASFSSAFLFLACFFWSAMRYLADFMPSLLVLSVIGFWQAYQALEQKPSGQKKYVIVSVSILTISILLSVILAISINDARFEIINWFTR